MSSKLDFEFLHEKESLEKYKSSKSFKWFLMAFLCFVLALGLSAAYSLGKIKGRSFEAENVVLQGIGASEIVNNNEEGELDKKQATPEEKEWVLYITGAVKNPGVYKMPSGSRVYQLVEKAGGLTTKADPVAINLAANLGDGCHLHVPEKGELVATTLVEQSRDNLSIAKDVFAGSNANKPYGSYEKDVDVIDLNRASAEMLQSLPGVGPKTAQAILDYRDLRGGFRSVEELLEVKGIGPKKMEKIRPYVTVGYR